MIAASAAHAKSTLTTLDWTSVLITIVSIVVMAGVSYVAKAPDYATIQGLTFGTASDEDRRVTRASLGQREVWASAAILLAILGAYLYFRG
jgi:solute:Na+ symporter, SSS family